MDMKQIFLYFAMLGTLAGLSSCLDEVPYGTYSNQTFYNTEADAESALMYAYRLLVPYALIYFVY